MESKEEMLSVGDTFAEAWSGFQVVFPVYAIYLGILVALLGVTAVLAFLFLHSFGKWTGGVLTAIVAIPAIIVFMIGSMWMSLATIHAAQNRKTTKKDSYRKAWALMGPYALLALVMIALIFGLSVFLLVPGIVFAIFSMFAINVLVKEKVGFFEAISRSVDYVKGYGWPVFGRLVLCWVGGAAISMIPILGSLVYLVFLSPFNIAFNNAIYEDLRSIKKGKPRKPESWTQPAYVKLALAGGGIGAIGLLALVIVSMRAH